jgi:hypothetical protein
MKPEDKIQPNSSVFELIREAHHDTEVEAWRRSAITNAAQAQEEFLRGYANMLAEVPTRYPEAIKELDKAVLKFKEMLKMAPTTFVREVLGVHMEPPDDTRTQRTAENVVQCEECPFSLVCLAGRIFGKNAPHNILCVKCGQLCIAREEGSAKDMNGVTITTHVKAESFYCQERMFTLDMERKYRSEECMKGASILNNPPWYVDRAPNGKWLRLSICRACEEHDAVVQRYRKQLEREHK